MTDPVRRSDGDTASIRRSGANESRSVSAVRPQYGDQAHWIYGGFI